MEFRILAERICGDIVLAEDHGATMKKWRQIFHLSQSELAKRLNVSPSVVSDYESGRRAPGVNFLRRFVMSLIEADRERGYPVLSRYRHLFEFDIGAILDIAEYSKSVSIDRFCEAVDGERLNNFERNVHGHTIIDSIKAILSLNAFDFYKLYGFTSERALVFTQVSTGRSPMVAVRVSNLKPSAVVLHGIDAGSVDEMAMRIAEVERIPLVVTSMDVNEMIESLRRRFV